MTNHLASHHGIGKFYKCLYCPYEKYSKKNLVTHLYNNHRDKPNVTSINAAYDIVYSDSFPFVMRNGEDGGGDGEGEGDGEVDSTAKRSSKSKKGQKKRKRKDHQEEEEEEVETIVDIPSSNFSSSLQTSTTTIQSINAGEEASI